MYHDIRCVLARSAPTLMQDLAGTVALIVLLMVALHLPVAV